MVLWQSKWAPASDARSKATVSPAPYTHGRSPEEERQLQKHEELLRFYKLLRRLKWKSCHLLSSAHAAIRGSDALFVGDNYEFNLSPSDRETMFRIDYYEFYTILERTIVSALSFFDIYVSADANLNTVVPPLPNSTADKDTRSDVLIGDSRAFPLGHKYHENVLLAVDHPSCPLREILGRGKVRAYLSFAKEFRNRWKDVERHSGDPARRVDGTGMFRGLKHYKDILNEEDMRLEAMLPVILNALDAAQFFIGREASAQGVGLEHVERIENLRQMHAHPLSGEYRRQMGLPDWAVGNHQRRQEEQHRQHGPEEAVDEEMMDMT